MTPVEAGWQVIIIQRLLAAALCAAAMGLSGAYAPPLAAAMVPCGTSLKDSMRADDPSHPGQFTPESGPCDDSLPSGPPAQAPPLILPQTL
jgi:hypothetical protein